MNMKDNIKTIILFLILSSCATVKIESNKSPEFKDKISKLLVIEKGANEAKVFFKRFNIEFSNALFLNSVERKIIIIEPLSLESEKDFIKKNSNEFNPQYILFINQIESRKIVNNPFGINNGRSIENGGGFDVMLINPKNEKILWRSNMSADGVTFLREAGKTASEQLLKKMIEDGLL